MSIRQFRLPVVVLLVGFSALGSPLFAQTTAPKVVLELFTSQGCSSCPPADALLENYTRRSDIVALSVHVDYWDRLGWKDTFASREFTARQYEYARSRGDGGVYTPQIVVSGKSHVVGSSRSNLEGAIADAKAHLREVHVPINLSFERGVLGVAIGPRPAGTTADGARLLLVGIQGSVTVAIGRGENANRKVTYHNVVRSLKQIGIWDGAERTFQVAKTDLSLDGIQSVAVLLQKGVGGPIVGAAQIRIDLSQ